MKKLLILLLLGLGIIIFFKPFFLQSFLPIPSDTIVGLYNPYRDLYAKDYPRGIPFKNFLITDPVRQEYPWRNLAISLEKKWELPLWNPYTFAGSPLLANFQSAVFYPLNILYFGLPFSFAWSIQIFLQPLLASWFMYLYLRKLKLSYGSSVLGSITFTFCGFSIAWLEWNTLDQTLLWLPLILLCIEFLISNIKYLISRIGWGFLFISAMSASLLAGHIQTFFYIFVLVQAYFLVRWLQTGKSVKTLIFYVLLITCHLLLTIIQWLPTLQFITLSARAIDQSTWQQPGWFIPWQNLIQFIAPDFFGNPTTLNYWGIWNYAEFSGYIGIVPLIFALFAIIGKRDKTVIFWSLILLICFVFALPNPIAQLPFILHIPFLSTSQPTRLLSIIDFSLAILAAIGFDFFVKDKKKIIWILGLLLFVFAGVWSYVFLFIHSNSNLEISKHNLALPTILLSLVVVITVVYVLFESKSRRKQYLYMLLVTCYLLLTFFDLLRFGQKFTPFTSSTYLFPSTKTIEFLQRNIGEYRHMTTDSQLLPPNFSLMYQLQTVDGYDPLFLQSYAQFIAASERNKPDISGPFGFNRIITPHNITSPFINLLGVKYVVSLTDIHNKQFTKVFQEGQTQIYENKNVLPRVFFVKNIIVTSSQQQTIDTLFHIQSLLRDVAVITTSFSQEFLTQGQISINSYSPNTIELTTNNAGNGFLVLTDVDYPTWQVTIDGKKSSIINTDYLFRGVQVPSGRHTIIFSDRLL